MKVPLPDELRKALDQHPDGIEVEDSLTQRVYFLTDADVHRRAMESLQQQQDVAAIQAGIDDMEAGHVATFEEVDQRIREKLGLSRRAS